MSKKITVKEFDIINEEILRSINTDYNDEFEELKTFIEEFVSSSDNEDAYNFMSVKSNRRYGEHVSFKNYVGLIQLKSGFQIEILPKIDIAETNQDIKRIFLNMLKSMKDFDGKTLNISNISVDVMNMYEIFINLYLKEVAWLIKRGLKSSYISEEANLNVLKGKLKIKEQIKQNIVHKERFFVSIDDYQLNRSENKLIKTTLSKLYNLSESSDNKKLCAILLSHFELVDLSTNYDDDFNQIRIDKQTKDYETLMHWSKIFLKNKSFTTFTGASTSRALLFQMDRLFESFVAKHMKHVYEGTDYVVSTQDSGYYLFNSPERKFKLKPDIVITKPDRKVIILDTKWKNLKNDPLSNYGISQADMYQMYAYSKKYGEMYYNAEVWLLYPLSQEVSDLGFIEYSDNEGVRVHVEFVDLANIDNYMNDFKLRISNYL